MAKGDHVAGAGTRSGSREVPQRIADELRALIVSGELADGESLGREPDLVERFGVSRPSLREALRILEAEGLITVERGVRGGVVAHEPDKRMTARTAALVLQSRNVSLADVFEARSLLEPVAARKIAGLPARGRKAIIAELNALIDAQEEAIGDPEAFAVVNTEFHERLVALSGNQTLSILIEMLNEIVTRAVTAVSQGGGVMGSLATRQRALRSQRRLLRLIEEGVPAAAEEHWRVHMAVVAKVMLGQEAATVVDLMHHYG
jgi:GntR family transcriptional regulator, transcriptional repressor for pyruvate dehydrogenase complex